MEFGTFVAIWANSLTILALYLFGSLWLLKNIPERYKREVCRQTGETMDEYENKAKVKPWKLIRYASYALIAQIMHVVCMWQS